MHAEQNIRGPHERMKTHTIRPRPLEFREFPSAAGPHRHNAFINVPRAAYGVHSARTICRRIATIIALAMRVTFTSECANKVVLGGMEDGAKLD